MVANEPDWAHLGRVAREWRMRHGWSQDVLIARGGPSKQTIQDVELGRWSSRAPAKTLAKIDIGYAWGSGTAWRVLTEGYDPVGGSSEDSGYVASPGARVEGGDDR